MGERTLAFRIDEEFHKELKVRLAQQGITLKSYIISLIQKDLEGNDEILNAKVLNRSAKKILDETQKIIEMTENK